MTKLRLPKQITEYNCRCRNCVFYSYKLTNTLDGTLLSANALILEDDIALPADIGFCIRHSPDTYGWPLVYADYCYCGDHGRFKPRRIMDLEDE